MKKQRVTTYDIAKHAGVSQSTVSMILHNKAGVSFSPETIKRVKDSANVLGYKTKKPSAFSSQDGRKLIAIISPNVSNPYYSNLIQSIENSASATGYFTVICNTYRDPNTEERVLSILSSSNIGGVIYTFMPQQQELVRILSASVPVVIITDKNESTDFDTIELNSIESGTIIADHLLSLGHRKIAFITTSLGPDNIPRIRRLTGVKERLEAAGASLIVHESKKESRTDNYNIHTESSVGYQATLELVKDREITAFIGVNDLVAYGIINALSNLGYCVPDDYSVCGFDNIFPSEISKVELTTIDHFLEEKGKVAFEILHKKITSDSLSLSSSSIFRIEYKPYLVSRKSTAIACSINKR